MSTILAALDTTAAARPVLETAVGIGQLTGASVSAVHVHDGSVETPEALVARAGLRLRTLTGPVPAALLGAVADPEVIAAVVGARAMPGGRRPVGRTAGRVMQHAGKPVVVVPPEAVRWPARPFRRLLVPLEGTAPSSLAVAELLLPLLRADVELVVVHVFTADTLPRALDRPARDLQILGDEFLARHLPGAAHIEFRTGPVGAGIAEVCAEEDADLIVLSWHLDASGGRAPVVREVLSRSPIPVLLLPAVGSGVVDLRTERAAAEHSPM